MTRRDEVAEIVVEILGVDDEGRRLSEIPDGRTRFETLSTFFETELSGDLFSVGTVEDLIDRLNDPSFTMT